jgi:hypothetical protein
MYIPINNGNPYGSNPFGNPFGNAGFKQEQKKDPRPQDQGKMPRFLNYVADYGGCGFWRCMWPEYLLNVDGRCMVHTSTVMYQDPNYYRSVNAVKFQRQAAPHQRKFIDFIKKLSEEFNFRIIYEIDDIPFREDIPDYNKHKHAFTSDEIRENIQAIMETCGNMSVTCDFMKEYFASKLDPAVKIDVIPNFIPKFWIGNFYNRAKIEEDYERQKNRPRICWAGSGAHIDVDNRIKGKDDFYHINEVVRKTVDDFKWIFFGGISRDLADLARSGKVEFIPWANLYNYPERLYTANINMFIAPLSDNNFNKSKSDLKYLEACALGLPIACQDLCTYKDAPIKFKTGDEMIDRIKETLSSERNFIKASVAGRNVAEKRFLETESNLYQYYDNYMYDQGDTRRKYLKP